MLRLVLTIMFILSSSLASLAANEHGTRMAIAQTGHAMSGHADFTAHETRPCEADGDCQSQAALCLLACAGMVAIAIVANAGIESVMTEGDRDPPPFLTRDGMAPDLFERPPRQLSL